MKLSKAQSVYLKMAGRLAGLPIDHIIPGSARRCVERLAAAGLVEERHVPYEGGVFFLTEAGRALLIPKATR